jgi:hypothetical protein
VIVTLPAGVEGLGSVVTDAPLPETRLTGPVSPTSKQKPNGKPDDWLGHFLTANRQPLTPGA